MKKKVFCILISVLAMLLCACGVYETSLEATSDPVRVTEPIKSEVKEEEIPVAQQYKALNYDDMKALNTELGFAEEIKVGETDLTVAGYSDTFIATSDLFKISDIIEKDVSIFVEINPNNLR